MAKWKQLSILVKTELITLQKSMLNLMMLKQVWKKCQEIFCKTKFIGTNRKGGSNIRIPSKSGVTPVIRRTQFPLMVVWACTVHKVQGVTLEKIAVNFDLLK